MLYTIKEESERDLMEDIDIDDDASLDKQEQGSMDHCQVKELSKLREISSIENGNVTTAIITFHTVPSAHNTSLCTKILLLFVPLAFVLGFGLLLLFMALSRIRQ